MARQYRKFDQDFKQGAVRLVLETGKPIAQIAWELGINEGTLGNWCARERRSSDGDNPVSSESERVELERLRSENVELRMQRDVLKRSVALCTKIRQSGVSTLSGDGQVRRAVPHEVLPRCAVAMCPGRGRLGGRAVPGRPAKSGCAAAPVRSRRRANARLPAQRRVGSPGPWPCSHRGCS